ncbi:folate-binding protein [Stenotrophomonas sp. MMGLT7]|uniref:CAF17-like 4Fe-4S cluster assembly/insertion protein YgfZ n=1 Tax=Stenotrophomonas sp. MMGLT7 TaxID=2901227 RepID=UPI001E5D0E8E|nr:folate-binding protein [Stenotrophomonas sp. MMGLT7]MCD7097265.1 folate-binding protein [Stenotrophomonas sp. MMGLT7]
MSHLDAPPFLALDGLQAVGLHGPDAVAFAQAQFSSDVAALPVMHWQWSSWLTAKGRVIAIFALLRTREDELLMLLPDGAAEWMAAQLKRFVFRRKLAIEVRADLAASARLAQPERAAGAAAAAIEQGWELDVGVDAMPRALRIVAGAPRQGASGDFAGTWRQSDLRLGLPRLEESQREQWTPQQLGLDRLSAYSTHKGCYPGQEIVARTHFLGKAKRATQLLQVQSAAAAAGSQVSVAGKVIGTVASAAGTLALAVLPLERKAGDLVVDGAAATTIPVLAGLAR